MTRRLRLMLVGLLLAPLACAEPFSARVEEEIIVLGIRGNCMDWVGPVPCFRAIRLPGRDTTAFYDFEIRGFTFELGVREHLLIERLTVKNPPADGSSLEFRLLRVIARQRVFTPVIPLDPISAQSVD